MIKTTWISEKELNQISKQKAQQQQNAQTAEISKKVENAQLRTEIASLKIKLEQTTKQVALLSKSLQTKQQVQERERIQSKESAKKLNLENATLKKELADLQTLHNELEEEYARIFTDLQQTKIIIAKQKDDVARIEKLEAENEELKEYFKRVYVEYEHLRGLVALEAQK